MGRVLLVVVLVLALAGSASAKPPHHRTHVSAQVPYVAPWQSGFDRYATQVYTPTAVSSNVQQMVIPEGQWWRVIYLQGVWVSGAVVGARTMRALVLDRAGNTVLQVDAPASQTASLTGTYLFGPALTSYSNTGEATGLAAVAGLPDLMWPPGDTVELFLSGGKAGDSWGTLLAFAVEIYTEADRPGVLRPIAAPLIP